MYIGCSEKKNRRVLIQNRYVYRVFRKIEQACTNSKYVNVNIRMYNFDDVQCTVIPSVAYGFVTGMNLQLC